MARPGKESSHRFNLTLTEEEAGRLEGYAASVERRPTTAAKELLLAGLAAAADGSLQDFADLQRRYEEVQRHRHELQRELDAVFEAQPPPDGRVIPAESTAPPAGARWEWPIEELLADTSWWDRWLPRLYELLGRDLRAEAEGRFGGQGEAVVDWRGYGDLLTYLFPPAGSVNWRSPAYPTAAAAQARHGAHEGLLPSVRPHVWEPVLRHVVTALCALEQTALQGTDPQLRLEAEARITGSWVQVLGNLVGQQQTVRLPRPIR